MKILETKLTQAKLKYLLHYNPLTGIFKWITPLQITHKVGDIAGHFNNDGYLTIRIEGKLYYGQRLAWLYMEGYFPENVVDHMDLDNSNNIWTNLRVITQQCNTRNCKISKNNTSGITGVRWDRFRNKWLAQIKVNYKGVYLGRFDDFTLAVKARWVAEKKYNFPGCLISSSAFLYLKELRKEIK